MVNLFCAAKIAFFVELANQIDIDWQVVAEAAEIARTDVSAKQLLSMIGLVILQHEIGMKDTGTTFLIMKTITIKHAWRDDDLVENLPIRLMLQRAFETETIIFPEQVDETSVLHLAGMTRPQHVVYTRVSGTVVQVAHHDDFGRVTFWCCRHDGIHLSTQYRRRTGA